MSHKTAVESFYFHIFLMIFQSVKNRASVVYIFQSNFLSLSCIDDAKFFIFDNDCHIKSLRFLRFSSWFFHFALFCSAFFVVFGLTSLLWAESKLAESRVFKNSTLSSKKQTQWGRWIYLCCQKIWWNLNHFKDLICFHNDDNNIIFISNVLQKTSKFHCKEFS